MDTITTSEVAVCDLLCEMYVSALFAAQLIETGLGACSYSTR